MARVLEDGLFPLLSQLAGACSAADDATTSNDELGGGLDWIGAWDSVVPLRGQKEGQTKSRPGEKHACHIHFYCITREDS